MLAAAGMGGSHVRPVVGARLDARGPERVAWLGLWLALAAGAWPTCAAAQAAAWRAKLDPSLIVTAGIPDTVTVWVSFAGKGEGGPADFAASLAAARATLTPRARARRERAGVWPLVDERDLPVSTRQLEALASLGLHPFAPSRWLNRAALRLPGTRLPEVAALPFVARVSAVERARRSLDPPAPQEPLRPEGARPLGATAAEAIAYGRSAAQLAQINITTLHDSSYIGTGVLVCVVDEGFNGHDTHEALRDQAIAPGFQRDFVEGDTVVVDPANLTDFNHGSAVLGCLGGKKPGTYMGAAFGASFALARTELHAPPEIRAEMLYWGQAAEWADSLGADILSSSLGYFTFDPPSEPDYSYDDMNGHTTDVSRFAQIAASKGILVVNAVGNQGNPGDPWHFLIAPADCDSLIAVGAVDEFGRPAAFSSYGPSAPPNSRIKPDVAARGVNVPVVWPPNGAQGYEILNGTSFAAPLVAGLAACLMQARPAWPPVQIIRALRESASRASRPDDRVGYGIADGAHALCWMPPQPGRPSLPSPASAQLMGPNPVRAGGPPAQVRFAAGGFLPGSNPARIRVFDLHGRAVRDLWSGSLARGQCLTVSWDGSGEDGRRMRSGCYFLSLDVGGEVTTARVAWLR